MFNKRHIERHQLPCVLKVFNRITGQAIGQLGNASEDGLMLISQLPVLVGPDYDLQLRLPLLGGGHQFVNLTASCLWCREDQTPGHYDSGFMLLQAPASTMNSSVRCATISVSARQRICLSLLSPGPSFWNRARIGSTSIQDDPVTSSIFWHDYETTGINPRCDRPLQVAGVRTDFDLNEIDEPISLYCRPSDDILPHPAACLVTGITPQLLAEQGLCEAEFMTRVHAQLAHPGTCGAGYNTLRFDDEVTRYSLYRNFFRPLCPRVAGRQQPLGPDRHRAHGLCTAPGRHRVAAAGRAHQPAPGAAEQGQWHRPWACPRSAFRRAGNHRPGPPDPAKQPKLYDWLFQLRSKHKVMEQIRLLQPLVHISGRFSAARNYLGVVLPLAWHPRNRNALIVCDLHQETLPLLRESAEVLRRRLYTRHEELAEGELPVPLKLVQVNRCPVVAPLSVLRPADQQRLGLDLTLLQLRGEELAEQQAQWQDKLEHIYGKEDFAPSEDRNNSCMTVFWGP